LLRRGYSKEQVAAIWGGNFLRVWREAQAAARP
jgi:membrane dipeptidase